MTRLRSIFVFIVYFEVILFREYCITGSSLKEIKITLDLILKLLAHFFVNVNFSIVVV